MAPSTSALNQRSAGPGRTSAKVLDRIHRGRRRAADRSQLNRLRFSDLPLLSTACPRQLRGGSVTAPVCVRLIRPDVADRLQVHSWFATSGIVEHVSALSLDDFLNRYPTRYWDHSEKDQGRLFLVAIGDQLAGAVVHHQALPTRSGRTCRLELWLARPELLGHGIGAHALDQLCAQLPDEIGVTVAALLPSAQDVRTLRACRRASFTPSTCPELDATLLPGADYGDAVCLIRRLASGPAIVRASDDFDRSQLMPLFRMADDSETSILRYRDQGTLYLLQDDKLVIGQLLVCRHAFAASASIESLALLKSHRRRGLGTALVRVVLSRLADVGVALVEVGTAAGDTVNLRFYQNLGFRLRTVQRDFFRPPDYPVVLDPEAIPLRDRVVCDIALTSAAVRVRSAPFD